MNKSSNKCLARCAALTLGLAVAGVSIGGAKANASQVNNAPHTGTVSQVHTQSTHSVTVTVQPGESLPEIADEYNSTVGQIMSANHLTSETVHAGEQLIVPINSSQSDHGKKQTIHLRANAQHHQAKQGNTNIQHASKATGRALNHKLMHESVSKAGHRQVHTTGQHNAAYFTSHAVHIARANQTSKSAKGIRQVFHNDYIAMTPMQRFTGRPQTAKVSLVPHRSARPVMHRNTTKTNHINQAKATKRQTPARARIIRASAPKRKTPAEAMQKSEQQRMNKVRSHATYQYAPSDNTSHIVNNNESPQEARAKNWIAHHESGGNYRAVNGTHYGKYQLDYRYLHNNLTPQNQDRTADHYVHGRYGSWVNAKSFWIRNGWY